MQFHLNQRNIKKILTTISLVFLFSFSLSSLVLSNTPSPDSSLDNQKIQKKEVAPIQLPIPPSKSLPDNQTTPGGGLKPLKTSCNNKTKKLLALLPIKNPVLTTSNNPTLLVYIPDKSEDLDRIEFWISSFDEKTYVYPKTNLKLTKTPGIVSLNLNNLPESTLQDDHSYHWYIKIYCKGNTLEQADLDINGWITKVPMTSERKSLIEEGSPKIWYDSSAAIAESLLLSQKDSSKEKAWFNLLSSINAQDLASEPMLGDVVLLEKK